MRYRNGWANRSCFNNIFIDIKINNTANNTSVIQIVGIDNYFGSFFTFCNVEQKVREKFSKNKIISDIFVRNNLKPCQKDIRCILCLNLL